MNDLQERVVKLLDEAESKENLAPWAKGYVPKHYKRLSIDRREALELAKLGASKAYAYFGTRLYFTQALLLGAVESGRYTSFVVVTPSQYGKSWLCGQIALLLANRGRKVYVTAATKNTTEIILGETVKHLQTVDDEIKSKLLEPADKIERMSTSTSKQKIGMIGGGLVEGISLGESYKDAKRGNAAIGRGGDYIIDEASLVSAETYSELGRREFASTTGEKYISFEISNPHNPGQFFDKLTDENVPPDRLIVWMDVRTALEEGRYRSKEFVIASDFFKHKSTCKRYLLCELEDYSEESLFPEMAVDDTPLPDGTEYFLGVDSAYKGKDKIKVALVGMLPGGDMRVCDHATIAKDNWIDGKTGQEVVNAINRLALVYAAKMICVDIGFGVYIVEGLGQKDTAVVKGINFGAGTTKLRKDNGHYSAVYGDNMRAELHMDVADLMDSGKLSFAGEVAEVLQPQLSATQAIYKPNGKTAIIPKDEIKAAIGHSPDELDAALLAVHAAILHSMSGGVLIYEDG